MTDNIDNQTKIDLLISLHDTLTSNHLSAIRNIVARERELGITHPCQHAEADFSYICDVCYQNVWPQVTRGYAKHDYSDCNSVVEPSQPLADGGNHRWRDRPVDEVMDELGIPLVDIDPTKPVDMRGFPFSFADGEDRQAPADVQRAFAKAILNHLDDTPDDADYAIRDLSNTIQSLHEELHEKCAANHALKQKVEALECELAEIREANCQPPPGFSPDPIQSNWTARFTFDVTTDLTDEAQAERVAYAHAELAGAVIDEDIDVIKITPRAGGGYRLLFAFNVVARAADLDTALEITHGMAKDYHAAMKESFEQPHYVTVMNVWRSES